MCEHHSIIMQKQQQQHDEAAIASSGASIADYSHQAKDQSLPIAQRMRAVFHLRSTNSDQAALALIPALQVKRDSVLLRHEVCFCLGQMARNVVVPFLLAVLNDEDDDVIVRHEAGEALGAIGDPVCVPTLLAWSTKGPIEVQETCRIALDGFSSSGDAARPSSVFDTIDPAPAILPSSATTIPELRARLMTTQVSLYDRYRAMFALRNRGDEEAVLALTAGFADSSALFRHEVAYVLGQLSHPASIPALSAVLRNSHEHEMVRHEAAESLGAIANDECLALLREYQLVGSTPLIVKESCDVALDAAKYWQDFGDVGGTHIN
jgi:deoxyhypusine monooxygenase